ncbi:hypothetical protein NDU88_007038 [Pleurodeles waltl]|uniref:Uncharacterized protein n=1 Tax=Pleurodeles waltl TaxID=8319 RepID=A0AAV7U153_PLEWA|nr:hypothetical protein NDU88_007038 [Pleurodeles waltl]
MADKDSKLGMKLTKTEPPLPEFPIKGKSELKETIDMILKNLLDVLQRAQSTKINMDIMQQDVFGMRSGIKQIADKLSAAEQRINDLEDKSIYQEH